jgi:hypothetical protein
LEALGNLLIGCLVRVISGQKRLKGNCHLRLVFNAPGCFRLGYFLGINEELGIFADLLFFKRVFEKS